MNIQSPEILDSFSCEDLDLDSFSFNDDLFDVNLFGWCVDILDDIDNIESVFEEERILSDTEQPDIKQTKKKVKRFPSAQYHCCLESSPFMCTYAPSVTSLEYNATIMNDVIDNNVVSDDKFLTNDVMNDDAHSHQNVEFDSEECEFFDMVC
jgi:hypothetical protein